MEHRAQQGRRAEILLIVLDHWSHIMITAWSTGHIPPVMRPVHKVTN